MLKQNLTPIPDDLPFKDYQKLIEDDPTVDPFDTLEMLGPVGTEASSRRRRAVPGAGPKPAPGNSPLSEVPKTPKN